MQSPELEPCPRCKTSRHLLIFNRGPSPFIQCRECGHTFSTDGAILSKNALVRRYNDSVYPEKRRPTIPKKVHIVENFLRTVIYFDGRKVYDSCIPSASEVFELLGIEHECSYPSYLPSDAPDAVDAIKDQEAMRKAADQERKRELAERIENKKRELAELERQL